jgi:hypothetical protein
MCEDGGTKCDGEDVTRPGTMCDGEDVWSQGPYVVLRMVGLPAR